MRRAYTIALVSFVVALPLLMAPTGGLPSRPRFQAVGVNVAAPATGNLTASGTITAATVTSSGAVNGASLVISGATATVNGVAIPTQESGTLSPTLTTGCTTTPTFNLRYARAGNVVTVSQTNDVTCTSNASGHVLTAAIPAGLRPAVTQCVAYPMGTDAGVPTNLVVGITTAGDINIGEGLGSSCGALGWTASGTATHNRWSGSYVLN